MIVYKAFKKDLTCLGFQYEEGKVHEESEANCYKNGFHCATNPLDCLSYYPDWDGSAYYIVQAGGDLHEDGSDTKISCTKLKLLHKLTLIEFIHEALVYMVNHPIREWSRKVREGRGTADFQKFVIVRGKFPKASGPSGSLLAFAKEAVGGPEIVEIAILEVDGEKIKPDTYYHIDGTRSGSGCS